LASVSVLANGGFVAVWGSEGSSGSDTSSSSIQGQRHAADGTAVGEEFQVNTHTDGWQGAPSVSTFADGAFVVVWQGGGDPSRSSIQGQRYLANGTAVGEEFQVNTYKDGWKVGPSVSTFDGGFVVVWESEGSSGSDASGLSIQGRRYAADGTAMGGEFQVNTYTDDWQWIPSVTALADGGFVAVWQSFGSSGSDVDGSIQGQRYADPRFALVGLAEKCLDIDHSGTTPGTPVILYRCHGEENQRFELELSSVPQRVVGIGGQCLVPGPIDDQGYTRVVTGECGGGDDLWHWGSADHAKPSVLVHDQTGMCLDVRQNATADFTPIILFDCHGEPIQRWRPAGEVCTRDSLGLCLNQERFRVDLDWVSFDGTTGSGKAVPVGSDDSGLLWFFEADNWEMLIKVLDGCAINDR
ncbi:MAG: ricin-type beta-trefoil lectin domain protein, partial [bacterium]|nr:ricin-type beta-trefoil lectin domain protein [bacterium]